MDLHRYRRLNAALSLSLFVGGLTSRWSGTLLSGCAAFVGFLIFSSLVLFIVGLPLLIQMPMLLAFFGMLGKAVALRGADWLWLHDLSSADPHHILPILMTVSQLLVQWYTPSPGSDVKQQKIVMCLMTIGFGYVSWHYTSGLALYALTGSLFSIATQTVMNRSAFGRKNESTACE